MEFIHAWYSALCSHACLSSFRSSSLSNRVVQLNNRTLKIIRLLGEGGFSYVYLVSDDDSQLYALKQIRALSNEPLRLALKEIEAYQLFKSPSIINVVDHAVIQETSGKSVYILLPYYKRGNLQDLINENLVKGKTLPRSVAVGIFYGITNALLQMHEPPQQTIHHSEEETDPLMTEEQGGIETAYAHFDLKPANIMLTDDSEIVLMDLGSCKPAKCQIRTRSDA